MHPFSNAPKLWSIILLASLFAGHGRADTPALDAAVLKKVKAATAHLEVTLPNGSVAEGSGFLTDEAGVVLTNAHVLGMLDADSRHPQKIAVTINSGEANSKTLPAKLLGIDRDSDLALLRIDGKDLPASLTVAPAKDLSETEEVFIFGFPLGKRLGKNITVSKSSISSLRKDNGVLKQIQVNGGMHPGNSGGPVVNGKGQVVGVAVAGITGTQLNFAIPGETVQGFLNGKINGWAIDLGYKEGEKVTMPFRIITVDPLGRIKNVTVETWTGDVGTRRRPGSATKPTPVAGDSERQVIPVKYDKQSITSVELAMPPLKDPKKAYWIQTNYSNGTNQTNWVAAFSPILGSPVERKEVTIRYQPKLNRSQITEVLSEGSFRFLLDKEEHSLAVNAKSTVTERTPAAKAGEILPMRLTFRGFTMNQSEDKKPIKADESTKRDVNNLRFVSADLEMEADGNVGKSKLNLTTVPPPSKDFAEAIGEQMVQSFELLAVPLPQGTLKPLQTWKAQRNVMLGTPEVFVPTQADIKYTFLGTRTLRNREIAFLNVTGTLKGMRGAGLNVGGTVTGGMQVALDTGEVLSATLNFKADMDLELTEAKGKKAKLFGTMKIAISRDIPAPAPPVSPPKKDN